MIGGAIAEAIGLGLVAFDIWVSTSSQEAPCVRVAAQALPLRELQ